MTDKELLLARLRGQRQHVYAAVEGLSDDDGHRAMLPSGWDVRGLLQHLARDNESFWFEAVVAGKPDAIERVGGSGWVIDGSRSLNDVVAEYRSACERADAVLAATDMDAPPAWWPEFFGGWRMSSVREIMLHHITETACHAGHLDAVRELIDGRQWLVIE